MIDIDKWQEIYLTLMQHKLRTALTAFGVFWGVFMLVVLLGAGKGLERGAIDGFGGRTNTVFLWIGGATQIPYAGLSAGRNLNLSSEDIEVIRNTVPELGLLSGINSYGGFRNSQFITRKNNSGAFSARGVEPELLQIAGYHIDRGRFINALDYSERRKVAVIGTEVLDILFEKGEDPIGENIRIGNINFQVIGVYRAFSSGSGARGEARRILLPNSTLRTTFNQLGHIGFIQMTPIEGVHASVLENKVRQLLFERFRIHPDDTGVIRGFNSQVEYDKVQSLFTGVRVFSWVVAIGTILAGVIGVGNIMLIVVKERTREIGVRKALGATSWNIISMIVQEALVLTLISGYLGLVVGVVLLEQITGLVASSSGDAMFGRPEIDFQTAFIAIVVLVVTGVLASLLPASKAAKVNPIVALQDE